MDERIVLYLITLAIHLPWLVYAYRTGKLLRYPIISFCFLGIFLVNAVGSILVAYPAWFDREDYYSREFFALLNAQAILFYLITGIYFRLVKHERPVVMDDPQRADVVFPYVIAFMSLLITLSYFYAVGLPPFLVAVCGKLSGWAFVAYRVANTYGRNEYYLYNLGFSILPLLAAVQALIVYLVRRKHRAWSVVLVAVCIFFTMLPGGKGSVLDIVAALVIGYLLYTAGYTSAGPRPIAHAKLGIACLAAAVPVAIMYILYFGLSEGGLGVQWHAVYRIFGVNPEAIAATISYTGEHGFLGGRTLPTVWGLFPHDTVNLSEVMHDYLFGPGGGVPLGILAEGYINFGWLGALSLTAIGLLVLVAVEETFKRIPMKPISFSLLVLYTLFATKFSQLSLFATFISLTYTLTFAGLIGLWLLMSGEARKWGRRQWRVGAENVENQDSSLSPAG